MTTSSLRAFCRHKQWAVGHGHRMKVAGRLAIVKVDGKEMIDWEASEKMLAGSADPEHAHVAERWKAQREAKAAKTDQPPVVRVYSPAPAPATEPEPEPEQDMDDGPTYMQAKTAREVYTAKLTKLDLEERQGSLISVAAVERVWASALAAAREHLIQVRSRVAPELAAETDQFKIEQRLEMEHTQALNILAGVRLKP